MKIIIGIMLSFMMMFGSAFAIENTTVEVDGVDNIDGEDYVVSTKSRPGSPEMETSGDPVGEMERTMAADGTGYMNNGDSKANMNEIRNQMSAMRQTKSANGGNGDKQGMQETRGNAGTVDGARMEQRQNTQNAISGLGMMEQYSANNEFGKGVSEFAKNFNNSYQSSLSVEEKINQRGGASRFFFGGDSELAESLERGVGENRELILELREQLSLADEEEKVFIEEQIAELQSECDRLEEVAQNEANKKGLFKWW